MPRDDLIPSEQRIYGWIRRVFSHGVRRPGYPADRWAEQFCLNRFRESGLENVRLEPVELPYWEPRNWSLAVWGEGPDTARRQELECFPVPHSAPTAGVEARLVPYQGASGARTQAAKHNGE